MTKLNKKVVELLAKHPNLSQEEAIKIVAEKNERKKQKITERIDRINAKKLRKQESAANTDET